MKAIELLNKMPLIITVKYMEKISAAIWHIFNYKILIVINLSVYLTPIKLIGIL
jgi:hypothetical protein